MGKKKTEIVPATTEVSEDTFFDKLLFYADKTVTAVDKAVTTADKAISAYDKGKEFSEKLKTRSEAISAAHEEKMKKRQEELAEIERIRRNEEIEKDNEVISAQLDALANFHKHFRACTVNHYLNTVIEMPDKPVLKDYYKKYGVNPNAKLRYEYILSKAKAEEAYNAACKEYKEKCVASENWKTAYNSIISGGEWFQSYIEYSVNKNIWKAFDSCGQEFNVSYSFRQNPNNKHEWFLVVVFPFFKSFKPVKKVLYDEKKTPVHLQGMERKSSYTSFMYSFLLQVMATVFDCADNVRKLNGNDSLIGKLLVNGDKLFSDNNTGKKHNYPVIITTMDEDQYHEIDINDVSVQNMFVNWLKSDIYSNLFFKDDYDSEVIEFAKKLEKME